MIAISILVHESPDVVVDQLQNIKKFLPNSTIILHINKLCKNHFVESSSWNDLQNLSLVNSHSLQVGHHDIIQAHNENFRFACKVLGNAFSKFCLHASNDMFVKGGAENYIYSHECGFNTFETYENMQWTPHIRSLHDFQLKLIMKDLSIEKVKFSQPEGVFYSKDIFQEMLRIMDKHFNRDEISNYMTKSPGDKNNTLYAREEIYYPTLASKLTKDICFPYLYSEVMTYDKGSSYEKISIERIQSIIENNLTEYDCIQTRLANNEKMYDQEKIYAVKRVARKYDDKVRNFIRGL
jgi:hypothetical protein